MVGFREGENAGAEVAADEEAAAADQHAIRIGDKILLHRLQFQKAPLVAHPVIGLVVAAWRSAGVADPGMLRSAVPGGGWGAREGSNSAGTGPGQTRFEDLTLISRQIGEDAKNVEHNSLRRPEVQEDLFEYIQKKQAAAKALSDQGRRKDQLESVVALFRKLREGLLSSGRVDAFTASCYEGSVDACLDADNFAELLKSLSVLVTQIYPVLAPVLGVEALPRRLEMAAYHVLYFLCVTSTARLPCGDPWTVQRLLSRYTAAELASPYLAFAVRTMRVLKRDVDYVGLGRLWRKANVAQRKFLTQVLPRVRVRIWTLLSKSFYTYDEPTLLSHLLWNAEHDTPASPILDRRVPSAWDDNEENAINSTDTGTAVPQLVDAKAVNKTGWREFVEERVGEAGRATLCIADAKKAIFFSSIPEGPPIVVSRAGSRVRHPAARRSTVPANQARPAGTYDDASPVPGTAPGSVPKSDSAGTDAHRILDDYPCGVDWWSITHGGGVRWWRGRGGGSRWSVNHGGNQ
ncbi:hypothetical protein HDU96_002505 [Phlyctochytrium bullatum]|nr:hypothetical protein HDU96_002505 [Phlyctochytrium bullatum]